MTTFKANSSEELHLKIIIVLNLMEDKKEKFLVVEIG